jgi:hypothetical protein
MNSFAARDPAAQQQAGAVRLRRPLSLAVRWHPAVSVSGGHVVLAIDREPLRWWSWCFVKYQRTE